MLCGAIVVSNIFFPNQKEKTENQQGINGNVVIFQFLNDSINKSTELCIEVTI